MSCYALGIDIGGTSVKLGLFSGRGELMKKWSIPTRTADAGVHILPDIAQSVSSELSALNVSMDQLTGAGIGVPGPVDDAGTVHGCVNLGWGVLSVGEQMGALLPGVGRIAVNNDANAAALGELRYGAGKGRASAAMFTLGTGIGIGVVLNGRIVSGAHGAAGELCHLTIRPKDVPARSLEQYASANGIVRTAKLRLAQEDTPSALRALPSFTAAEICDLARRGDGMCLSLLENCGGELGYAMACVAGVVDPELFIVGGGMSRAGDILLDPIRAAYREYAFAPCKDTPIVAAQLGNDAGIFGCAAMALNGQAAARS